MAAADGRCQVCPHRQGLDHSYFNAYPPKQVWSAAWLTGMPLLCCSVIPLGKCQFQSFYAITPKLFPVTKTVLQSLWAGFVQENFLSPQVVEKSLQSTDLSLAVGQWLANPQNNLQVTQVIQQTVPESL